MSILSHIVWQRLPNEVENVATEALTFILNRSDGARRGILKLLQGIIPDLPDLEFTTQTPIEGGRPDMTGGDGERTFVLLENKFWAGLTEQQPHAYLLHLAEGAGDRSILLFVCPAARATSLWHELHRRLNVAGIACSPAPTPPGIERVTRTATGPALALTTWPQLLAALDLETAAESDTHADIEQLRALCQRTDQAAWKPIQAETLTDQGAPALVLQLGALADEIINQGVSSGIMDVKGLTAASTAERIGRYALLIAPQAGVWIGAHFTLWRDHGATPLWLLCHGTDWARGKIYKPNVQTWARMKDHPFTSIGTGGFAVGLHLPPNTELPAVVDAVLSQIDEIIAAMGTASGATDPAA
jgi:hypothetical protein